MVDLDALAVLNDLSKKPDKDVTQDMGFKPQSVLETSGRANRDLTLAEESMRETLRPRGEPVQSVSKQDSVTVKMFESYGLHDNRFVKLSSCLVP